MGEAGSNRAQIEMWSGPSGRRWVQHLDKTDRAFGALGARTLELLAARPGERVMDLGCGAGSVLLALAEAVGPSGRVVGLEPSAVLAELAAVRTAHLGQVSLVCEDAAVYQPDEPFDAIYSCLGTMFFEKPVEAFGNLRGCLRPGGRLVFCCWQAAELNRWCRAPLDAILPLVAEPPKPPAPCAPGTFSLADRALLEGILSDAGFGELSIRDDRAPVPIGTGGFDGAVDFVLSIGPAASLTEKQPASVQAKIRERLIELFTGAACGDEVTLAGAAWIVSAVA